MPNIFLQNLWETMYMPFGFILKKIDKFVNGITMYRLTFYGLFFITVWALVLSVLGLIGLINFGYGFLSLFASLMLLQIVCHIANLLFSKIFKAPTNIESVYVTAFILFLILPPAGSFAGWSTSIATLAIAGIIAMASKYMLAIGKKHIFNPAAVSAFITGMIFTTGTAIWWVGSIYLLIPVVVVGFLIVRKIHRFQLFFSFILSSIVTLFIVGLANGTLIAGTMSAAGMTGTDQTMSVVQAMPSFLGGLFISWPLIFFGTIMLTEPLTTPPTKKLQVMYGVLVGIIFGLPYHIGNIYATPELALIIGNIFAYLVSPKQRLILRLKEKKEIASNIFHFSFSSSSPLIYTPGQYIEWTLPHEHPDDRGNRRYFTIASSPTEEDISIGVKIIPIITQSAGAGVNPNNATNATQGNNSTNTAPPVHPSSFKARLIDMQPSSPSSTIVATQVSGDFIMPKNQSTPLVFIAGGIGITPFRSMIKFLVDSNQKRDIVLFYACVNPKELAYTDLFEKATHVGVKFVPIITNKEFVPENWNGYTGFLTKNAIEKYVPNFTSRTYFLSGPSAMVDSYRSMLREMNINRKQIRTDYFPGF